MTASNFPGLALPKPEPRARTKGRKDRKEGAVKKDVRAACVERDGYCLVQSRLSSQVAGLLGACDGPSEWAHETEHRRSRTRGQAPEKRHTTAGSCMLCQRHHQAYDVAHAFAFDLYTESGMDGAFGVLLAVGA